MADDEIEMPFEKTMLPNARKICEAAPSAFSIRAQIDAIDVNLGTHPEVAMDLCRALIESVCTTILIDVGEPLPPRANAEKLVSLVLKRLELFADPALVEAEAKEAVGDTVTGICKFVNGIGKYRRVFGMASHGRDGYIESIDASHACLVAGVTDSLVCFIYESHRRFHGREEWQRVFLGDHPDFDQFLDDEHYPSPIVIFDDEYRASTVLYKMNPSGYVKRLNDWRKMRASGEIETEESS